MNRTANLAVKITSDASQAASGFNATSGFASKMGTAVKAAVALVATAVVAAGVALVGFIGQAANLEQSLGAMDVVFKQSSGQMREWASGAAESAGLTENAYAELATLIGTQLKNGGTAMDQLAPKTDQLIRLGADLSAMYGGSAADAVGALSSALKGERDPIEKYGISLKQSSIDAEAAALGYKKVGGSLSDQAQQAATLSLIMKQSADAQGSFARETDTLAHKQQVFQAQFENLTTSIGMVFLPIASQVMGVLSEWATILGPILMPYIEQFGAGLTALTENAGPMLQQFVAAGEFLDGGLMPAFASMGESAQSLGATLMALGESVAAEVGPRLAYIAPIVAQIIAAVLALVAQVAGALAPILTTIAGVVVPMVTRAFIVLGPPIMNVIKVVGDLVSAIAGRLGPIIQWLAPIVTSVFVFVIDTAGAQLNFLAGIIKAVTQAINGDWSGAWNTIKATFNNFAADIRSSMSSLGSSMAAIGGDIIRGLVNGIRAGASWVAEAAREVANRAVQAAKEALGINSPSKVFRAIGEGTIEGFVGALDAGHFKVARAYSSLVEPPSVPEINYGGGRYSSAAVGSGVVININVDGALDPHETANQIRRVLNESAEVRGVVDVGGVVIR